MFQPIGFILNATVSAQKVKENGDTWNKKEHYQYADEMNECQTLISLKIFLSYLNSVSVNSEPQIKSGHSMARYIPEDPVYPDRATLQ